MNYKLLVNGQERTFSEDELTFILEEYFQTKEQRQTKQKDGEWFFVYPEQIVANKFLFSLEKENRRQEATRKIILEAIAKVEKKEHLRPFKALIPDKTWSFRKSVKEIKRYIDTIEGQKLANWIEQVLIWAQIIVNGDPWDEWYICNLNDEAKYPRLVMWKNGEFRLVGGSSVNLNFSFHQKKNIFCF